MAGALSSSRMATSLAPVPPVAQLREAPSHVQGPELVAAIEAEIVPRLIFSHRDAPLRLSADCAAERSPPGLQEIEEIAQLAACNDLAAVLSLVEAACRQGLSLESVLLDLLAAAGRLLGEQWQNDVRSFTEVTAGLGTLQLAVHVLGPSFAPALPHRGLVVLVAAPGEQHTLGLYLLGEFLRRAGWGVQVSPTMTPHELGRLVGREHVALVGFSVSTARLLTSLAEEIAEVRAASQNPELLLMLGGSLDLRAFAKQVRAELCAGDAREVVDWLDRRLPAAKRS